MTFSFLACRTDRDDLPEQPLPEGVYLAGRHFENAEHHMGLVVEPSDVYCSCGLDYPCGAVDALVREFSTAAPAPGGEER